MSWQEEAKRMKFGENLSWTEMTRRLMKHFPNTDEYTARERIRAYIRSTPEYKQKNSAGNDVKEKSSLEYRADGTIVSSKFITLRDGEELTPKAILEAHGLKPAKWEVVNYINNYWNTQIKGGTKQISYQSKLTAKPKVKGIDFDEIDKSFRKLDRTFKPSTKPTKPRAKGSRMAEVNIADLHLGKLCWHGNTPENFDYKIARDTWNGIIGDVAERLKSMPLDYITFVWANDFFNADTIPATTTAGTQQECDIRWQKMFNVGCEMLVYAIEALKEIAPVKTFYTPSNHDELNGYHALKYLEAWFRKDDGVEVDISAYPRKYQLYGNTLIGYYHGDKENSASSKEKASRLASLMPIEAKELWGKSTFREFHTAHLHSEHAIYEINGVIVRRIASPTASDTWHTENGYVGAIRKAQTFVYDEVCGLIDTFNTPVM